MTWTDLEQVVRGLEGRVAQFERDCSGSAIGPTGRWRDCAGDHTALLLAVKDALLAAYEPGIRFVDAKLSRRLVEIRDMLQGLAPLYARGGD